MLHQREWAGNRMIEMVERVALAIADDLIRQEKAGLKLPPMCPIRVVDLARAAIAAMRQLSEPMVEAGMDATNWPISDAEVVHRYQAMIDAALKSP